MTTYTTYSEAGGVGKTTLAANLGAADVRDGRSVLAIDLDPQDGSLTRLLGADVDRTHDGDTLVHHLIGQADGDLEDLVVALTLFASHAIVAVIGYGVGVAVGRITTRHEEIRGHAERLEERLEHFEEGLDVD